MRKKWIFALILLVGSFLLFGVAAEVGFRVLYPDDGPAAATIVRLQRSLRENRGSPYVPHPFVSHVFAPGPGVNARGFRGEDLPVERRPGVKRIACIGGSTTVSYPMCLTQFLVTIRAAPVEIMNFGVPAWSTAESLVNLCLNVQDFKPDALVIHHAANDTLARICPGFRSDYSHWRKPYEEPFGWFTKFAARHSQLYAYWLWKRGIRQFDVKAAMARDLPDPVLGPDQAPLPATGYAFERNIRTMVLLGRTWGARSFLVTMPFKTGATGGRIYQVTIRDHNRRLRRLARELKCDLVDLAEMLEGHPEYFKDLVHFKVEVMMNKVFPIALALWKAGLIRIE